MKKTCLFYIVFQVLKVNLTYSCKIELPVLYVLVDFCFASAIKSPNIVFDNFLELNSKLFTKKFCYEFPFLTDSPLAAKISQT